MDDWDSAANEHAGASASTQVMHGLARSWHHGLYLLPAHTIVTGMVTEGMATSWSIVSVIGRSTRPLICVCTHVHVCL